jgi:uncharacterized alkaline shock family protein YloU
MSDGQASISAGILARYAADAANDVAGARARRLPRIETGDAGLRVEVHLQVDWGRSIPDVGRAVQTRVREYLGRMTDVDAARIDVVVDEVGSAT